jgi:hypothetical protein
MRKWLRRAEFNSGQRRGPPLPVQSTTSLNTATRSVSICGMRSEHGYPIAPSTFYEAISHRPSQRALCDQEAIALIEAERASNRFAARLGARKM